MPNRNAQQQRHAEHIAEVVSEVANALQVAAPLVDRVRVTARQQVQDCHDARIAIDRAVTAIRTLQPGTGREKGGA